MFSHQYSLQIQQKDIPFHLSHSGFKYLGITVTRKLSSLYNANFIPLIKNMKSNFQRWNNMPLSLAGRVQCVKMAILPIFLYTFQCLPTFLPKKFFKTIDQLVSGFLLGNKFSRISKNILQRKRTEGGLALPNFFILLLGSQYS